jgi:hypothetical protein
MTIGSSARSVDQSPGPNFSRTSQCFDKKQSGTVVKLTTKLALAEAGSKRQQRMKPMALSSDTLTLALHN